MRSTERHILIITNTQIKSGDAVNRVTAVRWSALHEIGNFRDYDVILLDWSDLQAIYLEHWTAFDMQFRQDKVQEHLLAGCKFLFYGDMAHTRQMRSGPTQSYRVLVTNFTGLQMGWNEHGGSRIEVLPAAKEAGLARYAKLLTSYGQSLITAEHPLTSFEPIQDGSRIVSLVLCKRVFARTRNNGPIAFSLDLVVEESIGGNVIQVTPRSEFVFLPSVAASTHDVLEILLTDLLGIEGSTTEPEWASVIQLEGEEILRSELASIDAETVRLACRRSSVVEDLNRLRTPLRLLYGTGRSLEPVVWQVLEALGAKVVRPADGESKEDGWITVIVGNQQLEGVLEIKTTAKHSLSEECLRQVAEWKERGISSRQISYKGIVVGGASIASQPNERPDPFSSSFRKGAELRQVAVITPADLFRVFEHHSREILDLDAFWMALFHTNGIFDPKSFLS